MLAFAYIPEHQQHAILSVDPHQFGAETQIYIAAIGSHTDLLGVADGATRPQFMQHALAMEGRFTQAQLQRRSSDHVVPGVVEQLAEGIVDQQQAAGVHLTERHGFRCRLENRLEQPLGRLPLLLDRLPFGDVAGEHQHGGCLAGQGGFQACLGFPVAQSVRPRVGETDGFALAGGKNPVQAGHPRVGDRLRSTDFADRAPDHVLGLEAIGRLDRRVDVEAAAIAVVARHHVGQVAGQGLEVAFTAAQCKHRTVQAPSTPGHGDGHQQGEQAGPGQYRGPFAQHALGSQGIDEHQPMGLALQLLVAHDAVDAINPRRRVEHPRRVLRHRFGQVATQVHALFTFDQGVASEHRGGTVVFQAEQAHAAARWHAL